MLRIETLVALLIQNVRGLAIIVVQRLGLGRRVCTSVTCAVQNVCVFHREPMVTRKNVHVITIGKPIKEHPSAPNSTSLLRFINKICILVACTLLYMPS